MTDDKIDQQEERLRGGLGKVDKLNESLNGVSELFKQLSQPQTVGSTDTGTRTPGTPPVQMPEGNQSSNP